MNRPRQCTDLHQRLHRFSSARGCPQRLATARRSLNVRRSPSSPPDTGLRRFSFAAVSRVKRHHAAEGHSHRPKLVGFHLRHFLRSFIRLFTLCFRFFQAGISSGLSPPGACDRLLHFHPDRSASPASAIPTACTPRNFSRRTPGPHAQDEIKRACLHLYLK